MNTQYDRIDFLEFFDEENSINQEKNVIEYKINYQDGDVFTLCLFLNDEKAIIKLCKPQLERPVFDVEIHGIKKITCDKNLVQFYKDAISWYADPFFKVLIRPYTSWEYAI